MSNMAHCRFSNTLDNLIDCEEHLDDSDLSKDEEKARKKLFLLCKRIVNQASDEELSD